MDYMHHQAAENWGGFRIDELWVGGWMYTYLRLRDPAEWKETESRVNAVVAEQSKELGYQGNAVISIDYHDLQSVNNQMEVMRNELMKSPTILHTSRHGGNVVGGLGNGWTTTENLEGEEISTSAYNISVDPDYFETYGMELAAGRFFSG